MDRHPQHHCCYIFLLWLLPVSSMAKDLWAIDCGSTDSYTATLNITGITGPTNITWEADDSYVHAGVSRKAGGTDNRALKTLRSFEAKEPAKGCYTIPVGKGRRVQVIAWFQYGNYDDLGQPPTFQLQFDANEWESIVTSSDSWTSSMVIYVTKIKATSICVARGRTGQVPFISALMLTVLEEDMYDTAVNSSKALFPQAREAFGANDTIVDKYFRYWFGTISSLNISDYRILNNKATNFSTTALPDSVPQEVLETAITPELASSNITITASSLSSTSIPTLFNMYFTEPVDPAGSNGTNRSFYIYRDGQLLDFGDDTIVVPPYGKVQEYISAEFSGSKTTVFDLVPTANATLPPVISAWELFTVSDLLSDGTDSRDVDGLLKLQDNFETLQDWAGDPCLPNNYNWEWVTCSSDASPRITNLDLSGYGLSGGLPDFSSLDALQTINLSNNSLIGDIPEFLAELPNLQKLNLANNDFSSIPSSLIQNSSIELIVLGNPKLPCTGQACSPAADPQPQLTPKKNSAVKNINKGIIMKILVVCLMYGLAAVTP